MQCLERIGYANQVVEADLWSFGGEAQSLIFSCWTFGRVSIWDSVCDILHFLGYHIAQE